METEHGCHNQIDVRRQRELRRANDGEPGFGVAQGVEGRGEERRDLRGERREGGEEGGREGRLSVRKRASERVRSYRVVEMCKGSRRSVQR